MATAQVITLDNPAGLWLPLEMLQTIGVRTGDQVEVLVNEGTLTVRSLEETDGNKAESTMDEIAESLLVRRRHLYERLAEGAK